MFFSQTSLLLLALYVQLSWAFIRNGKNWREKVLHKGLVPARAAADLERAARKACEDAEMMGSSHAEPRPPSSQHLNYHTIANDTPLQLPTFRNEVMPSSLSHQVGQTPTRTHQDNDEGGPASTTTPIADETKKTTLQGINLKASSDVPPEYWNALPDLLLETGALSVESFVDYPGQYWVALPQDADRDDMVQQALLLGGLQDKGIELEIRNHQLEAQEMWADLGSHNMFAPQKCGKVNVLAIHDLETNLNLNDGLLEKQDQVEVRILPGNGWGNGDHPSTRMCLEFLSGIPLKNKKFVDYGCGSGILSIAAVKLGAESAFATDVCLDSLANAEQNFQLNGVVEQTEVTHPRTIVIGDLQADIICANILPGVLIRLRHTLALSVKLGGLLCLSGMRPSESMAVKEAFSSYIDWDDSFTDTGRHPTWGEWMRIVGRPKPGIQLDKKGVLVDLSEAAVS